jgi:transcriptional regulator with XRE-family HTH domain
MANVSKSKAMRAVESVTGGPLTFGEFIWAIREGEEMSLAEFGKPLGVSRQHLNDIEKGHRTVSVSRAAEWAQILGYPPTQFVRLALQALLDAGGLDGLRVEITGKLRKAG